MNTNNLKKIIADAASITTERRELESQHAAILAEKEAVIADASGPNDKGALEKLNLLASRETIARHQLELIDRRIAGLNPSATNEATQVRNGLLKEVIAKRESIEARLMKALSPIYGSADAAEVVTLLKNRKPPAVLRRAEKTITALQTARSAQGQTHMEYARVVLSACERAEAIGE